MKANIVHHDNIVTQTYIKMPAVTVLAGTLDKIIHEADFLMLHVSVLTLENINA